MCGRYVSPEDRTAEYELEISRRKPSRWYQYSFNVCPTQQVPVVRFADGEREGILMRWGLVPVWANGVPTKYSTINATAEKIETGPAWRSAWRSGKRCIMVASGFYEWHVNEDGSKQPFYIHCNDQKVFGFAALWDSSATAEGEVIESCAIITLPANAIMAEIHNTKKRMPAILHRADYDAWLNGIRQVVVVVPLH